MQPSDSNALMLLTNWLSCHGGALHSNNEESVKRRYSRGFGAASRLDRYSLVTIGKRNSCIFFSDDHGEGINQLACSWMFACEEKRGMWCGSGALRMRGTLGTNGN